ncbi:unnamed protein product [Linum trigynum]|uniref:Uncharacterized protein n=1 Tax=Linum trigynum TaxID=586398 RepID=A0AAV2FMS8_9ROSI
MGGELSPTYDHFQFSSLNIHSIIPNGILFSLTITMRNIDRCNNISYVVVQEIGRRLSQIGLLNGRRGGGGGGAATAAGGEGGGSRSARGVGPARGIGSSSASSLSKGGKACEKSQEARPAEESEA